MGPAEASSTTAQSSGSKAVGKYDDVTSVDDPLLEGFTLDARKMFVADALKKRRQREEEIVTTQRWAEYIDSLVDARIAPLIKGLEDLAKYAGGALGEVEKKINQKPKVIIYDPSEVMKQQIQELVAPLLKELSEIKQELGLRQRGEVIDLPMLPKRRA
jgi:hypothetical protein